MRRITFNTLKIQGFGQYERLKVFKLNSPGLNVIRGLNGSGKTTIFQALSWVLYEELLKSDSSIQTWEHLRTGAWQGTMVSLSYEVDNHHYRIKRMKDYQPQVDGLKGGNRLLFEVDGELVKNRLKVEIQRLIEESLGMSFRAFTNSLVFQQRGIRFIEHKGPEKKKILEEFFRLTWITSAAKLVDYEKNQAKVNLTILTKELDKIRLNKQTLESLLQEMEVLRVEFEDNKAKGIKEVKAQIKELKKTQPLVAQLKAQVDSSLAFMSNVSAEIKAFSPELPLSGLITQCESKISEISRSQLKYQREKESWENELRRANKDLVLKDTDKVCRWCNSPLSSPEKREALIKSYKEAIEGIEKRKPQPPVEDKAYTLEYFQEMRERALVLSRKKDKASSDYTKALEEYQPASNAGTLLESLEDKLKSLEESQYQDSSQSLRDKLALVEVEEEDKVIDLQALSSKIKLIEWALKKPLSNTGIKAFLFDKLMAKLNERLRYYSQYTGFHVELIVDMESGWRNIEAIITHSGAPVSFHDLSGGESQMVNVSIALASGDILLSDTEVNIRVFDEVTEHLDEPSTELLAGFLKKLSEKHSVFVITHNRQFQVDGINEIRTTKGETE